MTRLLAKAWEEEASKLPEAEQDSLAVLANKALVEHHAGRTQPLIPERL